MNETIFYITPAYHLSANEYNVINKVGGFLFESDNIQLRFGGVTDNKIWDSVYLLFEFSRAGINSCVYISEVEAQRLLRVEVRYLSKEYLSFLTTKYFSHYGIHFCDLTTKSDSQHPTTLINGRLKIDGQEEINLLMDVNKLIVDGVFLKKIYNKLPGRLRLNVMTTPFMTYLLANEIKELSCDDVVFIYPK